MTLVKKPNVPINLIYGAPKTGDLKNDIHDPAHGLDFCNIKCLKISPTCPMFLQGDIF